MFPKQGTLQIIEDKTNIYGTLSCRLLSFAKVSVKFNIKVFHNLALLMILDQTSNLGVIGSFWSEYQYWSFRKNGLKDFNFFKW